MIADARGCTCPIRLMASTPSRADRPAARVPAPAGELSAGDMARVSAGTTLASTISAALRTPSYPRCARFSSSSLPAAARTNTRGHSPPHGADAADLAHYPSGPTDRHEPASAARRDATTATWPTEPQHPPDDSQYPFPGSHITQSTRQHPRCPPPRSQRQPPQHRTTHGHER